MADSFKLNGSYEVTPQSSPLSFAPTVVADINEVKSIKAKQVCEIELSADSPVAVPFGGVVNAHIVILKSIGGKVRARCTSTDGSAQAIPFDTYWILMSESVPLTSIDLTRVTGTLTTVRVFLAEKA